MQELHEIIVKLPHDLKKTEEQAENFIRNDKEQLIEAVQVGNLELVQEWFEEHFCKRSLNTQVKSWLFDHSRVYKNMVVREVFDAEFNEGPFEEAELNLVMDIITASAIHRRINADTMANLFIRKVDCDWVYLDGLLHRMVEAGFIQWNEEFRVFIVQPFFTLSREIESELDCLQSNIPMVCKPKKVYKPKDESKMVRNGYLTEFRSVFTKKLDDEERHQDIAYDFLNGQNQNVYRINYTYYDNYGKWNVEFPDQGNHSDADYLKICKQTYRHHLKVHFLISLYRILGIKDLYFLNVFCYRHRNYPVAYTMNLQGADEDKANWCFPPKPLTEVGLINFKLAIANDFNCKVGGLDLDKHTFDVRLKYVEEHFVPLLKLSWDEYVEVVKELAEEADSKHCFVAKMLDFWQQAEAVRSGKPAMTGIPCPFDATCSGYQWSAVIARDKDLAELTNVIMPNGDIRNDMYTILADRCMAKGLNSSHDRNFLKKKVWIPRIYGSVNCIRENFNEEEGEIIEEVISELKGVTKVHSLMEDWDPVSKDYSFWLPDGVRVYKKVYEDKSWRVPFMDGFAIIHGKVNVPIAYSCELAPNVIHAIDGFVAREIGRALHWNKGWKEYIYNLFNDPAKWKCCEDEHGSRELMGKLLHFGEVFNFYSLRILHEINEYNIDMIPDHVFKYLYESLPEEPCQVMEIHDSFATHPNYSMNLMFQYRRLMRDGWKSRLFAGIRDYLVHNPEGFTKVSEADPEDLEAIMKSVYALC